MPAINPISTTKNNNNDINKNITNNTTYVLLTGGTGYIGSHVLKSLLQSSYYVIILDNLSNSSVESINRVGELTNLKDNFQFYEGDIRDENLLTEIFDKHSIESVIHCAGLKSVGESTESPLMYHDCNVKGTICLLNVMERFGCKNLIFSSSATVYGTSPSPVSEDSQTGIGISNPYGNSKFLVEQFLQDLAKSSSHPKNKEKKPWNFISLRYFNPIGADESGRIGEDPNDIPNNLMPFLSQVCVGRRQFLTIFGDDYDTIDGTGVRDYIHVTDLAEGHLAALTKLNNSSGGFKAYNLGTGKGVSVFQIVKAMEKQVGKKIPYKIGKRRPGDLATLHCDPILANKELNWATKKTIDDCCRDAWLWQSLNPNGYEDPK